MPAVVAREGFTEKTDDAVARLLAAMAPATAAGQAFGAAAQAGEPDHIGSGGELGLQVLAELLEEEEFAGRSEVGGQFHEIRLGDPADGFGSGGNGR